jgi:Transglycosylase-like domain
VACHKPLGPDGALRVAMRLVMALASLAAVTAFTNALVAPVSADPLGTAQANSAELSQEVTDEAVLVHQLSLRYESDRAQANYLGSEVASSQATVQSLQARSRRTESLLRQEALFSYTDEVPAASSVAQFGGNLVELAAQRAYLSLTLGDVSATVVQLQSEQFQLGRALTTLRRQYHSELETGTVAANQRDQAIGEATALQGMLAQAQSQVALLTSEQHAQAGLPVGNGIVNAVNQQLGTTSSGTRTMAANEQAGTTGPTTTASSTPATTAPAATAPATTAAPPTTIPPTTAPPTTVPPTTAPPTTAADVSSGASAGEPPPLGGVWLELRDCESGDNYQTNTGNGFYGAYQFAGATWSGLGLPGIASDAPYWVQDDAAQRLQAEYGWKPWPACSAALGL